MRQLVTTIATLIALTVVAPGALAYSDGLYFSFGVGYAHALGDRGVSITPLPGCPATNGDNPILWYQGTGCGSGIYLPSGGSSERDQARHEEVVRADGGSMIGLQLRFGYNILGHASIEGVLSGAGSDTLTDGSVHAGGQVRWHPVELGIPHQDRDWDVSTFVGVGWSLAGYKPVFDADAHGGAETGLTGDAFEGKGWTGLHVGFGAGFEYQFGKMASVGIDMKIIRPLYSTWYANFEEPYKRPPVATPEAWIVTPTVRVTLHFWSPDE